MEYKDEECIAAVSLTHYRKLKYNILLLQSITTTRVARNYLLLLFNKASFAAKNCCPQPYPIKQLNLLRRSPSCYRVSIQVLDILQTQFQLYDRLRVEFFQERHDSLHCIVRVFNVVIKDSQTQMEQVRGFFSQKIKTLQLTLSQKAAPTLSSNYPSFSCILSSLNTLEKTQEQEQTALIKFISEEIVENILDNNISSYNKQYSFQKGNISRLVRSIHRINKEVNEWSRKISQLVSEKLTRLENRKVNEEDLFLLYVPYAMQVSNQVTLLKQYAQEVLDFWETFQEFEMQRLK